MKTDRETAAAPLSHKPGPAPVWSIASAFDQLSINQFIRAYSVRELSWVEYALLQLFQRQVYSKRGWPEAMLCKAHPLSCSTAASPPSYRTGCFNALLPQAKKGWI